ncbi:hypothetical protein [Paenibacillus sp. CGMCC 1.18879]|uniref:hypothetical protein n=1 Tax=Paenibacillus sp. CGMCC 1.18879 TaxID=2834466 RepID=UPI001CA906A1|nr:hypothetical protein [Paenibacillus sp. CGMCC 1.18879]MBY9079819.1 hypothetical protein [Paenibacillus sp. CGMCC 1.18879]
MVFAHLIVELHCLYGIGDQDEINPVPPFCKNGVRKPGYHCLSENCEFSGHAPAPLEIAYSDEKGEVAPDAWIGFGGDMDPNPYNDKMVSELKESWENICKKKVNDAYEDYMKQHKPLEDKE